MPPLELLDQGAHTMTVCNACRYCEQYCPVFPAMEQRLTFGKADLAYLANLCHNCGECLYACQYAPPHPFAINVPKTLTGIRLRSYEDYCWPRAAGAAFRRQGLLTAAALVIGFSTLLLLVRRPGPMDPASLGPVDPASLSPVDAALFYSVVPFEAMVTLFSAVFLFVVLSLSIGLRRFRRDIGVPASGASRGLRDALTLRHLHSTGVDCSSAEEQRSPWRRWFHHCTMYGFLLCFASTSTAAIYHHAFGWIAPYGYTSLPVVLGTIGGIGLVIGPIGLFVLRRRRDVNLGRTEQDGLDESLIALLLLTSLTGLALLILRQGSLMSSLLIVHLAAVLALFLTLPYGKFVHGLYRSAALIKYRASLAPEM